MITLQQWDGTRWVERQVTEAEVAERGRRIRLCMRGVCLALVLGCGNAPAGAEAEQGKGCTVPYRIEQLSCISNSNGAYYCMACHHDGAGNSVCQTFSMLGCR
jgi:hypothetical protein